MSHLEQRNFLSVFSTVVSTIFNTNKPMNLLSQVFADGSNTTNGTFPRPALRPAVVNQVGWPHSTALSGRDFRAVLRQQFSARAGSGRRCPRVPAGPRAADVIYPWERLETLGQELLGQRRARGVLEIWSVADQFMLQTFLLSVQTERIRWGDYDSIERKHTNSNTSTYANIPLSPVFSSGTYHTDTDGPVNCCVSPPAHCVLPKSGQFLRCLIQLLPTRHSIKNN